MLQGVKLGGFQLPIFKQLWVSLNRLNVFVSLCDLFYRMWRFLLGTGTLKVMFFHSSCCCLTEDTSLLKVSGKCCCSPSYVHSLWFLLLYEMLNVIWKYQPQKPDNECYRSRSPHSNEKLTECICYSSSHLYILYCDESIVLKVSDMWIALKSILKSIYRYVGYPSPWWWQPGCWLFVSAVCTIQRCFFLNSPHICPGVTWETQSGGVANDWTIIS